MKINTSLVLSTYNWPEALELVLKSIAKQTTLPDEVIIADDGSKEETKNLIEQIQSNFPVPIKHIWHEDNGFRRASIINKGIAKASFEYIISIDSDVILHPKFIEDHVMMAETNVYLYGSRVNIQESALFELFSLKNINFNFFSKGIKKRGRSIRLPFLAKMYRPKSKVSSKVRGCNLSFWKDDFVKVNGYNEEFSGWGREDTELVYRFKNIGVKSKRLKFGGIIYHIYHREQSKSLLNRNDSILQKTVDNNLTFAEKGINKYL